MNNIKSLVILLLISLSCIAASAETWDNIMRSGQYYYGVGFGDTEEEADKTAIQNLISQIAIHVSSDFKQIENETTVDGKTNHESRVTSCIQTYNQTTLTNTLKWPVTREGNVVEVKRYMKKTELSRIFDNRIAKAKNMLAMAADCLESRKIDAALQYYYWAYSLIRSVQFPNEVTDMDGRILVDWIPNKIDQILGDIKVQFDKREGDDVDLLFSYKNHPVERLKFTYSDGNAFCEGDASYGSGPLEMSPNYQTDVYHVFIEYQYKSQARGDSELESVLNVITPKPFDKAEHRVKANVASADKGKLAENKKKSVADDFKIAPVAAQSSSLQSATSNTDFQRNADVVGKIAKAIVNKQYTDVMPYFTMDGLEMFNRLSGYGKARILDTSNIKFYKGLNGKTVARGLKMAFSFDGRRKKTFAEEISFTFGKDNKIENVAFGLGSVAEDGIFNNGAQWSDDVREIILSFMENYKTAYSLERLDYIRDIFADDATIIVGNVVRRNTSNPKSFDGKSLSLQGQENIRYNRYNKDEYLKQLARCFNRNDFINLKFTNHQIQWLEKFNNDKIFAINIHQQYDSSTYADEGYLLLIVDMTDTNAPQIKIRTWQPNETDLSKIYTAGDFFND